MLRAAKTYAPSALPRVVKTDPRVRNCELSGPNLGVCVSAPGQLNRGIVPVAEASAPTAAVIERGLRAVSLLVAFAHGMSDPSIAFVLTQQERLLRNIRRGDADDRKVGQEFMLQCAQKAKRMQSLALG